MRNTNELKVWTVGPVLGVIQDIPTCQTLLKRIENEALETITKMNGLTKSNSKI